MLDKKKVEQEEQKEEIGEMGQESDTKAAKAVIELSDKAEKEDLEEKNKELQKLTDKRKLPKIYSYKENLALTMDRMLKEESFPRDYHYCIEIVEKGIRLSIWKGKGEFKKRRQFSITGEPKYDLHACMLYAYWAGDAVYHETREKKTQTGIILPN